MPNACKSILFLSLAELTTLIQTGYVTKGGVTYPFDPTSYLYALESNFDTINLTQAEYNALASKDSNTYYFIEE